MNKKRVRVGFVSTRLAGTDGVSLETAKWANILTDMGHECFFFAGESDWPPERSHIITEAHFKHPDIRAINEDLFGDYVRSPRTSERIQVIKEHLKSHLGLFWRSVRPDVLIAENVFSLPMNVPLGLALAELVAENNMPIIAHHHDFVWERERFAINAATDYLRAAFPPTLTSIHHVVINSFAATQLAMRTGERSLLIPNVMDFESSPPPSDDYTAGFRSALGIEPEEFILLQPTRIVPRKRIETSVELARRLDLPCVLVISHSAGDEGSAYTDYLHEFADLLDVRVIFASERIHPERGLTPDGKPIFSLADAYYQADLVTYPSALEGFGNAFLETLYYRRPIIMRNYEIFNVDIKPKGFKVITFGDFIEAKTVEETRHLLQNPAEAEAMVAHNYDIAGRYYSYSTLKDHLTVLMNQCLGT